MRTIQINDRLAIVPEMIVGVQLLPPVVQVVHAWRVVAILPMGGTAVLGSFGDDVSCFPEDSKAAREARALYESILASL